MQRKGRNTIILSGSTGIRASAGIGATAESKGPLAEDFDYLFDDDRIGCETWEKAESALHKKAVETAISKAGLTACDIDLIFAGDLLNQCTGSTFGIRDMGIPFAGMYGACSTMVLSLITAAVFADSGAVKNAVASTSSHFCSAEKQFRFPLEYGGQRTPTAQRTATAAGAAVVQSGIKNSIIISKVHYGRIQDFGITDANNMGAAMAPVDVKIEP